MTKSITITPERNYSHHEREYVVTLFSTLKQITDEKTFSNAP